MSAFRQAYGREAAWVEWTVRMEALARECPNVHVKLSGLGMCTVGFGFHERRTPPSSAELAAEWRPYVLRCIELFGVERCMFASNFPVDKVSCSYTNLYNAFKRIVADFSPSHKHALFYGNAMRVYRL